MRRFVPFLKSLGISVLVWLGIDAIFWLPSFFDSNPRDASRFTPYRFLVGWLAWWAVFAVTTPLVFSLARRWPLRRERWIGPALGFAAVLLALSLVNIVFRSCVYHTMMPADERKALGLPLEFVPLLLRTLTSTTTPLFLFFFISLAGIGYAVDGARRLRERERRSQQLENALVAAQLDALKGQLQPHFLFNTLHAIGVTAAHDGPKASRMIVQLGDLLRRTLETRKHQLVPLREELAILAPYLEIQRLRFADRLTIELAVPESLLDCLVPALMLQPIVENAIRHGIEAKSGAGRIEIRVSGEDESVVIEVEDDGRGLQSGRYDPSRDGIGLSATRARIGKLFDGQGTFALSPSASGGALACIRFPRLAFPKTA